MNRFVTFCIGVGIALLVLAVISNTVYAATTTETADGIPTMTLGTIDSGLYNETHQDNEVYQNLKETVDSHLDCYYNLSTPINESRISAFEIGVNAKLTYTGKPDSVAVYIWDDLTGSWDITTITGIDGTETTYSDITTMSTEHIRDSDGNIAIRFNDTSGNKQNTFNLDYLYVNLTYTLITSCNDTGYEINHFAPGENVSVKGTGLDANTNYTIWIQDNLVNEGDLLIVGENPSSAETPKEVTTDGNGNFGPTLIWSIPSDAPVTHHEYDIVVDNQVSGTVGTYHIANDGIDSASAIGMVAPVPDVSSLILFTSGLVLVSVYFVYGSRREKWKEEL